jgi:glycosyltransferase involved in cell wall biosynthesis
LVQAMAFGLPVVARAAGGVPETLAEAGLLIPPDSGVFVFGEALARVVDDPVLAGALAAASRRRAAGFATGAVEAAVLQHLAEVV